MTSFVNYKPDITPHNPTPLSLHNLPLPQAMSPPKQTTSIQVM